MVHAKRANGDAHLRPTTSSYWPIPKWTQSIAPFLTTCTPISTATSCRRQAPARREAIRHRQARLRVGSWSAVKANPKVTGALLVGAALLSPVDMRSQSSRSEGRFGRIIEVESGLWHSSDLEPRQADQLEAPDRKFCGEYGCLGRPGHARDAPAAALRVEAQPCGARRSLKVIAARPDGKGGSAPCETWDNGTLPVPRPDAQG